MQINKKIRYVLFDFDGTLYDSSKDLYVTLCEYMENFATELSRPSYDEFAMYSGLGSEKICQRFHWQFINRKLLKSYYLEQFEMIFSKYNGKLGSIYPGILGLLSFLHSHAITYGIVTNRDISSIKMALNNLQLTIPIMFATGSSGIKKPNARIIDIISREHYVDKNNTIFIGDAQNDSAFANVAGIPFVLCLYGFILDMSNAKTWWATAQVNSSFELASLIKLYILGENQI